jgi:Zn-dependent peptidase ImmA (M78 family)
MDGMSTAYINPKVLAWAILRCKSSPEQLATSTLKADSIQAWLNGTQFPTESQAEALADRLHVPYLVLFLESLPDIDTVPVPDLRTIGNKTVLHPSINFIDTLNDVLMRQDWYREYRKKIGAKPSDFVGRFNIDAAPKEVAEDMREVLRADRTGRRDFGDSEEFTKGLIINAEDAGILVMRSGCVGHSTNRLLDVEEFRGFALSDSLAPVVFVNGQDTQAAQNFTLAHEFAHLWVNQSGVSNVDPRSGVIHNNIERFCNQVAAEFLVPGHEFNRIWDDDESLRANVQQISVYFKVSNLVALIRALELDRIQYPAFRAAYERAERRAREKESKAEGGQFWNTFPWRVSNRLGTIVVESVRKETTTYSEAAKLLGLKLASFETYFRAEGGV